VALPLRHHYVAGVPGGACPRSRDLLVEAGASWTAVTESGHWPFLDRPDRFVEVLRSFLG